MKKKMKKFFASLLAFAMMFSTLSLTAAAEEEEYLMFLAYGGESQADAWNLCWANEEGNESGITATTAMAKVGDTVTIGVTLPEAATKTWYVAPVIIAEGVSDVSYTIDKVTMDGNDITDTIDLTLGEKEWWYEGTGNYTETQAVRLKGGYNEWADKYIAESPVGFTTMEYTITLNSITLGGGEAAGEKVLSEESYPAFIAFGGDEAAENDWGFQYYGDGASSNKGDVVATNGELKNGETTTLTLEFPSEVFYTWFTSPCFIAEDASAISPDSTFEVKVLIDGEEVATDLSAGKSCWAEGTGDYADTQAVRIGGGYNEWGDKYIAESPKGFKTLTFEVTPTIYVAGGEAPAEEEAPANEFDPNGTYHAYLGVQTPTWIFRNSYDDATYGKDSGCFDQLGFVDGDWIAQGGTFTDVEITGNGTYTVSLTGYDFSGQFDGAAILGDEGLFNLLFVSTDLPVNDEVVISNVVLKMDGKTITELESAFLDPDSKTVQKVLLANIWNKEITALPYYAAPTQSIEVSFDVSGFANDAVQAEPEATEAPSTDAAAEATEAPAESSGSNTGLIIGIVVAVVVVAAAAAGVVVAKKKKGTK